MTDLVNTIEEETRNNNEMLIDAIDNRLILNNLIKKFFSSETPQEFNENLSALFESLPKSKLDEYYRILRKNSYFNLAREYKETYNPLLEYIAPNF